MSLPGGNLLRITLLIMHEDRMEIWKVIHYLPYAQRCAAPMFVGSSLGNQQTTVGAPSISPTLAAVVGRSR